MSRSIFLKKFINKKVLITGHTGFKGSWLTTIMSNSGAKIYGISKNYPSSFYKSLKLKNVKNYIFDLKNLEITKKTILKIKPDFIFHLAAQSIVSKSYINPIETWNSNLISFLNVLESLRFLKKKCSCVMITSDKCYLNKEKKNGYKENEILGGFDNYSSSKASCEILFKSYYHSYFKNSKFIRVASGRAGNVIGGGDWSKDRLIPDIIRSIKSKKILEIRNPNATRPWQHVIEPISGYIQLAIYLTNNKKINGESFNFGPYSAKNYSVKKILDIFSKKFENFKWKRSKFQSFKESALLNLNCKKAMKLIKWKSKLSFVETINETVYWYKKINHANSRLITNKQIKDYFNE